MHVKTTEAKRRLVLAASAGVFGAHGYSRTTMGDLAKAAGMSRPALYLVFPRKEQLFSTLLRDAMADRTDEAARSHEALVDWLVWACSLWTGRSRPAASHGEDGCSFAEKHSEYLLIEGLLLEGIRLLLPLREDGGREGDAARLIATCMRGLSEIPLDEEERRRLLGLQVDAVCRFAGWLTSPVGLTPASKIKVAM